MERDQEKGVRLLCRAYAAFVKPEVYEYLESRDTGYAMRPIAKSPSSACFQRPSVQPGRPWNNLSSNFVKLVGEQNSHTT